MTSEKGLSAADIRYLLTLQKLLHEDRGIRCVDIASALALSKPSVHSRMKSFVDAGLVEKESYGVVYLTKDGKELACRYQSYAEGVEKLLLTQFPDLPAENSTECLCQMLAAIPEENLKAWANRQ